MSLKSSLSKYSKQEGKCSQDSVNKLKTYNCETCKYILVVSRHCTEQTIVHLSVCHRARSTAIRMIVRRRRANPYAFTQSRLITDGCANAFNYIYPLTVQWFNRQSAKRKVLGRFPWLLLLHFWSFRKKQIISLAVFFYT